MLLSDKRIMEEMERRTIVIAPFDERHLGTNSYDCRLGEWYFAGDANLGDLFLHDEEQMRRYWGEPRNAKNDLIPIRPGTTILAHTQEVIGGCNGFLAKMHARSSVARSGLSVCRCAGVGDVGYISRWTMEMTNHNPVTVWVPVGYRVAQMVFYEVGETLKAYTGSYGQAQEWSPSDMVPKTGIKAWEQAQVTLLQRTSPLEERK